MSGHCNHTAIMFLLLLVLQLWRVNSSNGSKRPTKQTVVILKDKNGIDIFEKLKLEKQHLVGTARRPVKVFSIYDQLKKDKWQLHAEYLKQQQLQQQHEQDHHHHIYHHGSKLPLELFHIPHIWENVHVKPNEEQQQQPQSQPIAVNNAVALKAPFSSTKKATKKKTKKKKKKKRKRKKKPKQKRKKMKPQQQHLPTTQVLFATAVTTKPHYDHHQHYHSVTTPKPTTKPTPPSKSTKYVWYKSNALVKKKKEYLNHLSHVIYPFVKFVVFFTVINPFTLGIFAFTLISPIVFGFLGFVALSVLVKPGLHLLYDVKHRVNAINGKKSRERRRQQLLWAHRRPITIHKHYYKYQPLHHSHKASHHRRQQQLNPILHKIDNYE